METFLKIAEIKVAHSPCRLKTVVGSCIALCLWDRKEHIGGMAHIMLPQQNGDSQAPPGKYADSAVQSLINQLIRKGASINSMTAACIGGASMFTESDSQTSIGWRNYQAVKEALNAYRISITTQSVGGRAGRKVGLNCTDGSVEITTLSTMYGKSKAGPDAVN